MTRLGPASAVLIGSFLSASTPVAAATPATAADVPKPIAASTYQGARDIGKLREVVVSFKPIAVKAAEKGNQALAAKIAQWVDAEEVKLAVEDSLRAAVVVPMCEATWGIEQVQVGAFVLLLAIVGALEANR